MCGEVLRPVEAASEEKPGTKRAIDEAALPRGERGQAAQQETSSDETSTSKAKTQLLLIAGIGVMLVLALFFITHISQELSQPVDPVPADAEEFTQTPGLDQQGMGAQERSGPSIFERLEDDDTPLPGAIAGTVDSLRSVIEQSDGEQRAEAQRQKINMLVGAGRVDRAAVLQREIAESEGTAETWRRTGDLFYEWMENMESGGEKAEVAEAAVEAYQRVLAERPDDLDVRADMATAYLETNEPMRGVDEVQAVLEEDPDHLQARFNYGIMLAMIGRTDESIEQFEHAKRIVGEDSPFYRQAEQIIEQLRLE